MGYEVEKRGRNIEIFSLGRPKLSLIAQKKFKDFVNKYHYKGIDKNGEPFVSIKKRHLDKGIKLFLELSRDGEITYNIKKTPKNILKLLMKKAGDFAPGTKENDIYDYRVSFVSTVDTPVDLMGMDGVILVASEDGKDIRVVGIDATGDPNKLSGEKTNTLAYVYDATLDPVIDKYDYEKEIDRVAGLVLKELVSDDVRRFRI